MSKLVTIGMPVYKRLNYLPQALSSVYAQDYPNIELIVSDNGMNGSKVSDLVNEYYPRPYRFRQNHVSVDAAVHFNQIIHEASGEYFLLLGDDDEISPNYVSELSGVLDNHQRVSVAFSQTVAIDESGRTLRSSNEDVPSIMSGEEFIRAWCLYRYGFIGFATNLARTSDLRRHGGFPDFSRGNHSDNALVAKLCLGKDVAFSQRCWFRYRVYEASTGLAASIQSFATASVEFLEFLDTDPTLEEFARTHPERWAEIRGYLRKMVWETYFHRWRYMYRQRLSRLEWVRGGFALPFIGGYYRAVLRILGEAMLKYLKNRVATR